MASRQLTIMNTPNSNRFQGLFRDDPTAGKPLPKEPSADQQPDSGKHPIPDIPPLHQGKSSHPDFVRTTAYIRQETKNRADELKHRHNTDYSTIVDEALQFYLSYYGY